MALTKEDLQAISDIMDDKISKSEERMTEKLINLEDRMSGKFVDLEERMTAKIESSIAESEERMTAKIESSIAESEERVTEKLTRHYNAVIESDVNKKLDTLAEGLTGWNERNRQIDRLEDKYEDHNNRIWALEQVVRK
jgi:hypothetical protein